MTMEERNDIIILEIKTKLRELQQNKFKQKNYKGH